MDKYHDVHVTGNGIIGDNSTDPLAVKSRTVSTDEVSCVFALCISYTSYKYCKFNDFYI